jgi:hypothetical protein
MIVINFRFSKGWWLNWENAKINAVAARFNFFSLKILKEMKALK